MKTIDLFAIFRTLISAFSIILFHWPEKRTWTTRCRTGG